MVRPSFRFAFEAAPRFVLNANRPAPSGKAALDILAEAVVEGLGYLVPQRPRGRILLAIWAQAKAGPVVTRRRLQKAGEAAGLSRPEPGINCGFDEAG